ncbi:D-glycerate 3-kinase [Sphingomonas vulcanisoli]|uniref:D-glycerate 3-kinase n=1 Tax=Sphingomonas vulcanisoli TaxID=1658060 RepID=A0ABX0TLU2_9SPHN|nr:kinase [Sphingomonas vulcanisoli]NIJ06482.1 D-glycerate 3-kinase [Sphingomonas vulcanisoli]
MSDPQDRLAIGDALLAAAIVATLRRAGRPILVGLSGAQGSGKSHTGRRLAELLCDQGQQTVVRSLDDFYLTRAERQTLAAAVHPLLATRGVPGTHDIALLMQTVDALLAGDTVALPRFDKTIDDRADRSEWPVHAGPVDVVLIEGWCIGARAQPEAMLAAPINALERAEDSAGRWRRFVNDRLAGDYAAFNARYDLRLMLRAPDFGCVLGWRAEQERGLDRRPDAPPPMDDAAVGRFIAHYERITRWMLEDEPADLIADLDAERMPYAWRLPQSA